jgi:5'-3' exonuclease
LAHDGGRSPPNRYLARRLAGSAAWSELTVLLSDAATAGEGEHKVVALVREQRAQVRDHG